MRIIILDTKNQVVENITRYQGTVNSSVLQAAEIFRPAIIRNCPGVIICHNHPSGDPTPSRIRLASAALPTVCMTKAQAAWTTGIHQDPHYTL